MEKTKEKVEWVETQVVDTQIELNEAKYQFGEQKERLDDAEKKMKVGYAKWRFLNLGLTDYFLPRGFELTILL